jgi:hypothetical protein
VAGSGQIQALDSTPWIVEHYRRLHSALLESAYNPKINRASMKARSVIIYFISFILLAIFPVAFITSAVVSDSFVTRAFSEKFDPVWIGFGIAVALLLPILAAFWKRVSVAQRNSKAISASQRLAGILILFVYLFLADWMLASAAQRALVRFTSHESRFYLTSAQPVLSRKCNAATWYDREVDGMVDACATFALFSRPVDPAARRASVVHVLAGPYGVRVLSIHALDSYFGQEDLRSMLDRR